MEILKSQFAFRDYISLTGVCKSLAAKLNPLFTKFVEINWTKRLGSLPKGWSYLWGCGLTGYYEPVQNPQLILALIPKVKIYSDGNEKLAYSRIISSIFNSSYKDKKQSYGHIPQPIPTGMMIDRFAQRIMLNIYDPDIPTSVCKSKITKPEKIRESEKILSVYYESHSM